MGLATRTIALAVAGSALAAGAAYGDATPGTYKGTTDSDGLAITIKVGKSGKSGSIKHCGVTIKFDLPGKTFSVDKGGVEATGRFKGDKVTGKIKPTSCTSAKQTFSLKKG